jgi:hypothetical protein
VVLAENGRRKFLEDPVMGTIFLDFDSLVTPPHAREVNGTRA